MPLTDRSLPPLRLRHLLALLALATALPLLTLTAVVLVRHLRSEREQVRQNPMPRAVLSYLEP